MTIYQYLQHKKIAKDFANYLDLYRKYRNDYHVDDILAGKYTTSAVQKLQEAPFDERLSVMGLLLSRLTEYFTNAYQADLYAVTLHGCLKELKERYESAYCAETPWETLNVALLAEKQEAFTRNQKAGLFDKIQEKTELLVLQTLEDDTKEAKQNNLREKTEVFDFIKQRFSTVIQQREYAIATASAALDCAFGFLEETFGAGQEMVIFITELTNNYYSVKFISENGSDTYYRYNKELLFEEKQQSILQDIEKAKAELDLLF